MKNFIAYSAQTYEQEFFETHEEALKWLKKSDLEGADEGFSLEACEGGSFIAKITHRSQYIEDDNKENYCQCEDENCENEHWDYSHDSVGHIEYKEVSHGDKCHVKLGPECPPECKRNELSLREVCELFKECDAECWRNSYEPCEKCILQGSDRRCLKNQLWDAINEDRDIDKAITLYNQIQEELK